MTRYGYIGPLLVFLLVLGCGDQTPINTPYGVLDAPVPLRDNHETSDTDPYPVAVTPIDSQSSTSNFRPQASFSMTPRSAGEPTLPGHGWPLTDHIVADRFERTMITDESIIGLHCQARRCVAASKDGGIFVTDAFGDWLPRPTTLPSLVRFFADDTTWLACPEGDRPALLSTDGGVRWTGLNFSCGHEGHRTVHLAGDETVVLFQGQIRMGPLTGGAYRWISSPLPDAQAIVSSGEHLLVMGSFMAAASRNGGRTFETAVHDLPMTHINDLAMSSKGIVAAVGQAVTGEAPFGLSYDGGLTWKSPAEWPTRSNRLDFVVMDLHGRIAVSSLRGRHGALRTDDQGTSWHSVNTDHPLAGAVAIYVDEFAFASPRGVAVAPSQAGMYPLGLTQPLSDVLQIQPRIALGLGLFGGVYRSEDGGTRWFQIPRTEGLLFHHLLHLGSRDLVATGDSFAAYSRDSGLTWTLVSMPNACASDWLVLADTQVIAGCSDGSLLRSGDQGQTWAIQRTDGERLMTQVRWVAPWRLLLGLDRQGERLYYSDDMGRTWHEMPIEGVESIAEIQGTSTGLSVRTVSGRLATLDGLSSSWTWLSSLRPIVPDALAHRRLADGRWIVLGPRQLWSVNTDGHARVLARVNEVHGLRTTPSGDLLLLAPSHTVRLARTVGDTQ